MAEFSWQHILFLWMPSSVEISISINDSLKVNALNRQDIPLPETSFEHN